MKMRIIVLCVVFLGAAGLIARASKPEIVPVREPLTNLPMRIGNWIGQDSQPMDERILRVLGVEDYIDRTYYNPDLFAASLYIGYYESQREGDTIHSPLNCLPGAGWNPAKNSCIKIAVGEGKSIEINRIVIMKGVDKQLVLYWYQSHGRSIASEYWGKIYAVLDAVRTNRTDAALIRVFVPISDADPGTEKIAEENAVDFVKAFFPLLERFLPE